MSESVLFICVLILVVLTLGTPDLLDGLIATANGCKP